MLIAGADISCTKRAVTLAKPGDINIEFLDKSGLAVRAAHSARYAMSVYRCLKIRF